MAARNGSRRPPRAPDRAAGRPAGTRRTGPRTPWPSPGCGRQPAPAPWRRGTRRGPRAPNRDSPAAGGGPARGRRLDHRVAGHRVERVLEHVDAERGRELPVEPAERRPLPMLVEELGGELLRRGAGGHTAPRAAVKERGDGLGDRFPHGRDHRPRRGHARRVAQEVLRLPQVQRAGKRRRCR